MDPFSTEGAKRISHITGQSLATTPIDAGTLTTPQKFDLPAYSTPTSLSTAPPPIDFGVEGKQAALDTSLGEYKGVLEQQGEETARRGELETQYGVPEINKQLNEYYAQDAQYVADLSNVASRTLQQQLTAEDRPISLGLIRGEQAQAARQAAFLEQNVNIKRATNSALISAAQGRLSLAQDYIQRALDTEFKPLESKIEYLKAVLDINKESLSKAEAAQLQQHITENERSYQEGVSNKSEIYSILITAQKFGADAATLQKISSASTKEDAARLAGDFLKDPKAKYELESARLDNLLKQAQITKLKKETAQIGQPTPSEREASAKAAQASKDAIPGLNDKIANIGALVSHTGLDSAVGPTALSRYAYGSDRFGAKQDFIAGVQQVVSRDTLDTLINLKAQGGTLGALSDQERTMLQSSASKIGTWAVYKDGNVTGYNTSESAMKKELETVQILAERARDKAVGNAGYVTPSERTAIQQFLSTSSVTSTSATINPALYFK